MYYLLCTNGLKCTFLIISYSQVHYFDQVPITSFDSFIKMVSDGHCKTGNKFLQAIISDPSLCYSLCRMYKLNSTDTGQTVQIKGLVAYIEYQLLFL